MEYIELTDLVEEASAVMNDVNGSFERITDITVRLGELASRSNAAIQNGQPLRIVAAAISPKYSGEATDLNAAVDALAEQMRALNHRTRRIFEIIRSNPDIAEQPETQRWTRAIIGLANSAISSYENSKGLPASVENLGRLIPVLRTSTSSLGRDFRRIWDVVRPIQGWATMASDLTKSSSPPLPPV